MTPLGEGSARRRDLYLTAYTTLTRDRHPFPWRYSNPQLHQVSGCRPDKRLTQILEPFFKTRFDHSAGFPSDSSLATHYFSHPVTFVSLAIYPSANPPTRLLTYPPNHPPILLRNLLSAYIFICSSYALFLPSFLVSFHVQTHTHTSTHFPSIHTSHTYCDLLHYICDHRYSQSSIVPFHLSLFTSLTNRKFIHKEKSNKMQQCIKILVFHIYMKLLMMGGVSPETC
jgi:hypothetical protein